MIWILVYFWLYEVWGMSMLLLSWLTDSARSLSPPHKTPTIIINSQLLLVKSSYISMNFPGGALVSWVCWYSQVIKMDETNAVDVSTVKMVHFLCKMIATNHEIPRPFHYWYTWGSIGVGLARGGRVMELGGRRICGEFIPWKLWLRVPYK